MEYTNNELENVIALCEQEEDSEISNSLAKRCRKALAYRDVLIRFTKNDKQFLTTLYDESMDEDTKKTLKLIFNLKHRTN